MVTLNLKTDNIIAGGNKCIQNNQKGRYSKYKI